MINQLEQYIADFSTWIWDWPLLVLLIGGGSFFLIYSRFTPFLYFKHAITVLSGKYDSHDEPGQLSHFQALSAALAATVGMGNISGVAIAIVMGGPGAIFWMWVSAIFGMATKFYTCTLAVMYRKVDADGKTHGGPMYVITKGLSKKWKPLAVFFALAGLVGTMPAFTSNQLTQTLVEVLPFEFANIFAYKLTIGFILAGLASLVVFGGINRIGAVASRLVPFMVVLYFVAVFSILIIQIDEIPNMFRLIFTDAFSAQAVAGGALGYLIKTGIKRAAFSNEAGVGTAPMMHGNAKTNIAVREGLVAMIGPAIDTLLVCTLTALAILSTGVWEDGTSNGISLTLKAFNAVLPYNLGSIVLTTVLLVFGLSTLFSYAHYGTTCLGFLTKPKYGKYYNYFYIFSIVVAAVIKLELAINIIDSAFALMAIPTVISAVLLSKKVNVAAKQYFKALRN